jgi:hypothetical protein
MATVIDTLSACVDCLMFVANGDESEDRDIARDIARHLGLTANQHLVCSGDGDDSDEFSWSQCECCGSRLGGSRHPLAILES